MSARVSVRRSTVDIGRAFELHCLRFLTDQLYMSLTQVGGAGDGGVDLRGSWTIPSASPNYSSPLPSLRTSQWVTGCDMKKSGESSRRLRVLGQCKAERKALGPRIVRELEGVMAHQRDPEIPDTIAILLSQSGFSPKAMIHATRSSTPLLLLHLPGGRPEAEGDGIRRREDGGEQEIEVEGAVWNNALGGSNGLLGGEMELRREILNRSGRDEVTGDARVMGRVGLFYNGKRFRGVS